MSKIVFVISLVLCAVQSVLSARILGVFPTPSISHQVVFLELSKALALRGHNLTIITTDPLKDPPKNLRQIDVNEVSYGISRKINYADVGVENKDVFEVFQVLIRPITNALFNNTEIQELLKRRDDFDVILVESIVMSAYGFAHAINAPLIGVASFGGIETSFESIGSPTHPILYPDLMTKVRDSQSVLDRLLTLYDYIIANKYRMENYKNIYWEVMKQWIGEDCPHPSELEKKLELLILNSYPVLTGIRPMVPAVINAGGLHIKIKKSLPKDLQEYLDNSSQGVIYFSFGSNVLSKHLPNEIVQVFLDVFSQLPYNILWKYENEELAGKPNNVKISKWLPQNDLLGHPNIKLFITQAGLQSMEEAINNAVPLLAIPFMGDQEFNANRIKILKIGLKLEISRITKNVFRESIERIINDPSFKQNVTKLREIINDEPDTGMERAIWWIEYVIRHKGAKHLRSPAADVTWAEFFMLDVLIVLAVILIFTLFIIAVSLKVAVRFIKCSFVNTKVTKKLKRS